MEPQSATVEIQTAGDGAAVLRLSGDWSLRGGVPSIDTVTGRIDSDSLRRLSFDTGALGHWDSALLLFLDHLEGACKKSGAQLDRSGLPDGVRRLVVLAGAVPQRTGAREAGAKT